MPRHMFELMRYPQLLDDHLAKVRAARAASKTVRAAAGLLGMPKSTFHDHLMLAQAKGAK